MHVQLNNHSSDHHPIITRITLLVLETRTQAKHLSTQLKGLDNKLLLHTLQQNLPKETATMNSIVITTQQILTAITLAYNGQGRWITTNPMRSKAWWNKEQLGDLIKLRSQARRMMLRHQTDKFRKEYYHYQHLFKQKGPDHAYQAYKFTKNKQEEEITPLWDQEGNLTSNIIKKLFLLFNGTSLVETSANLNDISHQQPPNLPPDFPPITKDKVTNKISTLPNRKAPGPDGIPNELIKLSTTHLTPILTDLYNCCLRQGQYPSKWKESRMAIINKDIAWKCSLVHQQKQEINRKTINQRTLPSNMIKHRNDETNPLSLSQTIRRN
ncbi:hypothetical protein O181_068414 [Austropuccinia psidii MF-1]|uniref:Reverse transcriptase domain-containing protein n=1 Tax=Austropuccinia psidii MF-1 TaxID=1389203 RepID=A0A9Q3I7I9_9BASI|nr:hypothetical protein [Austropuccinia psidii MF-1]